MKPTHIYVGTGGHLTLYLPPELEQWATALEGLPVILDRQLPTQLGYVRFDNDHIKWFSLPIREGVVG